MISIELNKKLDYETYKSFWNLSVAGADFAVLIKQDHPLITLENAEQYIDNFYNDNKEILEQNRGDLTDALQSKQKEFFDALKSLFKADFSSNSYKGYISIFNCNPRFLDSKTFQVFYKRSTEDKLAVVFHKVLHFAFFEYCENNFAEKIKGLDKNSGKLWELSEIFNMIVLNTPQFINITGKEEKLFYPKLNGKLIQAKIIWDRVNGDVYKFTDVFINDCGRMNTKFVGHHVSAGGFIFHKDKINGATFVLLIKNKKGEYWIPKGHIEEGEDQVAASFREIEEEVGLKKEQLKYIDLCHIHKFSFVDDNGDSNTKEVYMNVFEAIEKPEIKLEEGEIDIQDGKWLSYEDSLEKIIPYSRNELVRAKEIFENFINKK